MCRFCHAQLTKLTIITVQTYKKGVIYILLIFFFLCAHADMVRNVIVELFTVSWFVQRKGTVMNRFTEQRTKRKERGSAQRQGLGRRPSGVWGFGGKTLKTFFQ